MIRYQPLGLCSSRIKSHVFQYKMNLMACFSHPVFHYGEILSRFSTKPSLYAYGWWLVRPKHTSSTPLNNVEKALYPMRNQDSIFFRILEMNCCQRMSTSVGAWKNFVNPIGHFLHSFCSTAYFLERILRHSALLLTVSSPHFCDSCKALPSFLQASTTVCLSS